MVASDLYALKGLWLKETLKDFKKLRKLKNEARLYMGNQSTVETPPHPPPSQTAGAKRGLRIFGGLPYSRRQVKYHLI